MSLNTNARFSIRAACFWARLNAKPMPLDKGTKNLFSAQEYSPLETYALIKKQFPLGNIENAFALQ